MAKEVPSGAHDHREPQSEDMLRKLGYEASDVSLAVLAKWIAFLFIFIFVTAVVTLGIYWVFVPSTKVDPGSGQTVGKLPAGVPALQTHPKTDMRVFRQQEETKVSGYGYADEARTVAHVPVEEMIDKIAAEGRLPAAEPGGGKVPPARGEDQPGGAAPNPATPGGGASQGPAGASEIPGMPNQTTPGPQTEGPSTNAPDGTPPNVPAGQSPR